MLIPYCSSAATGEYNLSVVRIIVVVCLVVMMMIDANHNDDAVVAMMTICGCNKVLASSVIVSIVFL